MRRQDYDPLHQGMLFDIQRFSVHDGPGIRTVVFLKGCPLRCLWCSNPESQAHSPELGFTFQNCIGCGQCFAVCPTGAIQQGDRRIDREKCVVCGSCAEVCYARALTLIGKPWKVAEVITEVKKDVMFYRRSGGGVTVSGGEPLAQPEFLENLLRAFRSENIHSAIETSGYASEAVIKRVFPLADLILYDLKHMDSGKHREYTGVGNERILYNAQVAVGLGTPVIIRVPVIPGYNDSESNIAATALFAKELGGIRELHLLPYHRLGQSKYRKLDRKYPLEGVEPPPRYKVEQLAKIVESYGLKCSIGGE